MHRNVKSRKRSTPIRVEETVRVASLVQKAISTGRSSYMEMDAVSRVMASNIRSCIHSLKPLVKESEPELSKAVAEISSMAGKGYTLLLTPNGIVKAEELEQLIEVDSETTKCLDIVIIKLSDRKKSKPLLNEDVRVLKELINEKRKLVSSFRA